MNSKFKSRFQYDWLKYVAVVLVSVLLWGLIFVLYHSPEDRRTIRLFFAGRVSDYNFCDKVNLDDVDFFDVMSCNPDDNAFSTKYASMGLNTCDVILVPKSVADATWFENTIELLENTYGKEVYLRDEKVYGIFLPSEAKQHLSAYFLFSDEDYVVMICSCSVNAGEKSQNAFAFVEWLVNYEE